MPRSWPPRSAWLAGRSRCGTGSQARSRRTMWPASPQVSWRAATEAAGGRGPPSRRIPARGSAQVRRDVELLDDRPPHGLGVDPVRQGLVDGPLSQRGQDTVLGHTARVRVTELRAHPRPELAEPHGPPLMAYPRTPGTP